MRPKPIFAVIGVLAVLGLLLRQVTQAVRRTFGGGSTGTRLARATPAYQNGLTLMAITSVSPNFSYKFSNMGQETTESFTTGSLSYVEGDTGLWIRLPPNISLPAGCFGSDAPACGSLLTFTARASDGSEIPMRWRISSSHSGNEPTYILASIPAGYPDTIRWADVTLDDHHGDTATWRILHLPPMQHVLAPPVTPQTTFHQGNITLTAQAYRAFNPSTGSAQILCDVTGTVSQTSHRWKLVQLRLTREWEPPGYTAPDGGVTLRPSSVANNTVTFKAMQQAVYSRRTDPYPNASHWVRLEASLQEFATCDETAMFHNVSFVTNPRDNARYLAGTQPQTVTTPSGIRIVLNDPQHQEDMPFGVGGDGFSLLIHYPQATESLELPASPLWRKYKAPINVYVKLPPPYKSSTSSTTYMDGTYSFICDQPLPDTFAQFPVIVHQWLKLRTIPVTFTLPVQDKAPGLDSYSPRVGASVPALSSR